MKYIQYYTNSGFRDHYFFDGLAIRNNSITFYNINGKPTNKTFLLGSLMVFQKEDSITSIEVTKIDKFMDYEYFISAGNSIKNTPRIQVTTIEFEPTRKINIESIGEKGIFKDFE